ncbi:hypothetical protein EYF80_030550 [Liparis tanakae]|uniref:Uncharacterized protein n=1 Tax=Liparis tanakae TaxID=230148 RepID=A0A4Z2H1T1_9TELE|nr:hypothetical protein EYF80_030550 [Liparis tanakae]
MKAPVQPLPALITIPHAGALQSLRGGPMKKSPDEFPVPTFSPPAEFILDRFIQKRWAWLVDPAPSPLLVRRERRSAAASPASAF